MMLSKIFGSEQHVASIHIPLAKANHQAVISGEEEACSTHREPEQGQEEK